VVIESHRLEGWGSRMRAGTYGIAAYWVDTTKDTDRYGSSRGYTDTDQGDKWADHLGPEGRTRQYDLLLPGDSVTYRGVTVTVVRSGAYDTVRVTRG
jgi:hypothetical protein